jgi:hypothetical protein
MVDVTVTWGLLAAWIVHDLEELLATPRYAPRVEATIRRRFARLPAAAQRMMAVGTTRMAVAILLVGLLVAAGAEEGARTGGSSPFFQVILAGFGLHAVFHVGATVAVRGYTPGVVTAILVVAPFSVWAWLKLERAGLIHGYGPVLLLIGLLSVPVTVLAAHAGAYLLLRRGRGEAVH